MIIYYSKRKWLIEDNNDENINIIIMCESSNDNQLKAWQSILSM